MSRTNHAPPPWLVGLLYHKASHFIRFGMEPRQDHIGCPRRLVDMPAIRVRPQAYDTTVWRATYDGRPLAVCTSKSPAVTIMSAGGSRCLRSSERPPRRRYFFAVSYSGSTRCA